MKIFKKYFIITIGMVLIMINFSCKECDHEMFFYKYYLYPHQEITLEVNDIVVYQKQNEKFFSPNPLKPEKYCDDFCMTDLQDKLVKVRFKVNKSDTILFFRFK